MTGTCTGGHAVLLIGLTYYDVVLDVEFIVDVHYTYFEPAFFLLGLALLFLFPVPPHIHILLQVKNSFFLIHLGSSHA